MRNFKVHTMRYFYNKVFWIYKLSEYINYFRYQDFDNKNLIYKRVKDINNNVFQSFNNNI